MTLTSEALFLLLYHDPTPCTNTSGRSEQLFLYLHTILDA